LLFRSVRARRIDLVEVQAMLHALKEYLSELNADRERKALGTKTKTRNALLHSISANKRPKWPEWPPFT
jgi:hypothetical protein